MIEEIVTALGSSKINHAYFLNTLSLLEYAGARKIVKSQRAEDLNEEILGHIAEEIRHARILKKMALQLSHSKLDTYKPTHLLGGDASWNYIQTIDHSIEKELGEKQNWVNYLYTTLIIEERAMKVYPIYASSLAQFTSRNVLDGLIVEEENHLTVTRTHISRADEQSEKRLESFRRMENFAFQKFSKSVCESLGANGFLLNEEYASQNNQCTQGIQS